MLSKRFQKQTIKEMARLKILQSKIEGKQRALGDELGGVNQQIVKLKEQLGFDPEAETAPHIGNEEDPLAIPENLRRI